MIVVTAPTGLIGHQVLDNVLKGGGEPVRVVARDPSRLPPHVRERVEVVEGSHGDRDVVDHAFAGTDSVFWLVPPDPTPRAWRPPTWTSAAPLPERSRVMESSGRSPSLPWAAGRRWTGKPGS